MTFLICCILKRLGLCVWLIQHHLFCYLVIHTHPGPGKHLPPVCAHFACFGPQDVTLTLGNCVLPSVSEISCNHPFLTFSTLIWFSLWQPINILVWDYRCSFFKDEVFISMSYFPARLKILSEKRMWQRLPFCPLKSKRINIICKELFLILFKNIFIVPPKILGNNCKIPSCLLHFP